MNQQTSQLFGQGKSWLESPKLTIRPFTKQGGAVQVGAEHAQEAQGRRPPRVQPAARRAPLCQGVRQGGLLIQF